MLCSYSNKHKNDMEHARSHLFVTVQRMFAESLFKKEVHFCKEVAPSS